jgi:hypothetical protein
MGKESFENPRSARQEQIEMYQRWIADLETLPKETLVKATRHDHYSGQMSVERPEGSRFVGYTEDGYRIEESEETLTVENFIRCLKDEVGPEQLNSRVTEEYSDELEGYVSCEVLK